MGLDSVELIVAFEDAFGVAIPNEDAAELFTPRRAIDYLVGRLPGAIDGPCLSQRAFYRVRDAMSRTFGTPRGQLRPETPLFDVLPRDVDHAWGRLRIELRAPEWPSIGPRKFLQVARTGPVQTVGELAGFLVERAPTILVDPREGWSRSQIADVVDRLIRDQTGVVDYTEDSEFGRDLGVD